MSSLDPGSVYQIVGEPALRRLVSAFYRRVPGDDILGPMYPPHEMEEAERRLADFLIYRFGGPDTYLHQRGNPMLRMRHAPFAITPAARDRWVLLMDAALNESEFPAEALATVKTFLHEVATFLINRA